ncbi:hypothetical protein GCM10023185_33030 [Hymenobacter saemangeumensis]|uniref:Uncharacterized protein n=1 Tax=Hymenobacter saemangeumensis TaxID=1084522 RepID=A0ABP8IN39_9BACT
MCFSPDIIPLGTQNLNWTQANNTYGGPDLGQNVVGGQVNNIYVRAKNLNAGVASASVSLYYSLSSLLLTPSSWTQLMLPGTSVNLVDGQNNTNIAAQTVALVQAPLLVSALPVPPPGQHYCLIAVANNNNVPATLPQSFPSNAAFCQWVRMNPFVAWRNITYVPSVGNTFTNIQLFGNENSAPATCIFTITGQNLGTVSYLAQCNDSRLSNPFSAQGTFVLQTGTTYTASFAIVVPANISGLNNMMAMSFTLTNANSQPFPASDIVIVYYQVPSQELDELEALVQQPFQFRLHEEAELETQMLIQIGSNSYIVNSGSQA